MGELIVNIGGGGGADLDEVTARDVDVLAGKKIVDANGNVITGKMPDQGTKNYTLPINGTYTIPSGRHSGSGKVTQNIPVQGGSTIVPGTSNKTAVAANRYVNGNVIVSGDPKLVAANIKKNTVIFGVKGTFEGWVPEPQDLFYGGQLFKGLRLQDKTVYIESGNIRFKVGSSISAGGSEIAIIRLHLESVIDVSSYNSIIIEGYFSPYPSNKQTKLAIKQSPTSVIASATVPNGSRSVSLNIEKVSSIGGSSSWVISSDYASSDTYISRIRLA